MKKCSSCEKEFNELKEKVIKEEGVLGYYDKKVKWCDDCIERHNYYLLANWG